MWRGLTFCFLFISLLNLSDGQYTCKWYGECYHNGADSLNCPYEGPPLYLNATERTIDILERRCSRLLLDSEGNRLPNEEIMTCCSTQQLEYMDESFLMLDGVLGRCPSCLQNFMNNVCEFSCGLEQSKYMETYIEISPEGVEYVNGVELRMNREYMEKIFNTCSGVMIPQMGIPAVNIMCGSVPVCDFQSWFDFQGDASSIYVPVQISYIAVESEEDVLILDTLECNEAPEGQLACACSDCFASCPVGAEPEPPAAYCEVLSINCASFSIGILTFIVIVTVFSILTVVDYFKYKKADKGQTKKSKKVDKRLGPSKFDYVLSSIFSSISVFAASNPTLIIMFTSWICLGCMYGIKFLYITANPIEIWSSPTSQARIEMEWYEERFQPFYRTTQVFFTVKKDNLVTNNNVTYGPAFHLDAIKEFIALENKILNIGRDEGGVVLEEICLDPMKTDDIDPDLGLCTIMSISNYVGYDIDALNEAPYLNTIQTCMNNFYDLACLASWGGGTDPKLAFGGFVDGNAQLANTLLLTMPLRNHKSQELVDLAMEWELRFVELLKDYEENNMPDYVDISFGTERSIEDELILVSQGEAITIVISYILMFIYVMFNLGKMRSLKTFLQDSKIMVAVASIFIVLLSIACALGILGYAGVPLTLLAINVIPFFILSVGVDNIFIMVNTLDVEKQAFRKSDEAQIRTFSERRSIIFGRMMGKVGPSILTTSLTQLFCFGIGTLSNSPAVYTFALFATISLSILCLFQYTISIAVLSLDYQRSEDKRFDVFCCIQKKILNDDDPLNDPDKYQGLVQRLIKMYAKVIFKWQVKIIVAIIFAAWLGFSIMAIPHIEIGLDQEMALPYTSYVRKYLVSVATILEMGPPVYFVLTAGLNLSQFEHQNLICGGRLCDSDSLYTQIYLASLYSDVTHIQTSSNSWIDDYFDWTTLKGSCCKYNIEDNSFCSSTNTSSVCSFCDIELESYGIRPTPEEFENYFRWFLLDVPTDTCTKSGRASYAGHVNYILNDEGRAVVAESSFMAYHTQLSSSKDFYEAYGYAKRIADNITDTIQTKTGLTDVKVFPYSIFYVYYDFYLTMWEDSIAAIGYSLLVALSVLLVLSSFNLFTTFAIMCTVIMVLVDMLGLMYLWNIPLNPVSLVNLIISIGIGVEFCSHTVQAFTTSEVELRMRPYDALIKMGANVINGITLTNIPIVVLAFSYTEIIETLFFRMFFGLVIIGFAHGIIFLPVLLSFMVNVYSYKKPAL